MFPNLLLINRAFLPQTLKNTLQIDKIDRSEIDWSISKNPLQEKNISNINFGKPVELISD